MAELKKISYEKTNRFVLFLKMLKGVSNNAIERLVQDFSLDGLPDVYDRAVLDAFMEKVSEINKSDRKQAFDFSRMERSQVDEALEKCRHCEEVLKNSNASYCTRFDDVYPWQIRDSRYLCLGGGKMLSSVIPSVLYCKGDVGTAFSTVKACAVVGAKQCSEYAIEAGRKVSASAVSKGYAVVGGLMPGCETAGHEGCLQAGGKTIAVMASGIDNACPPQDSDLAERIVSKGGLLLSEQHPGTSFTSFSLMGRNRIQALLSDKVIVLQSPIKGEAMNVAKNAYEFGKQVYVLDPKIFGPEDDASGNAELVSKFGAKKFTLDDLERVIKF
ncbi:MAG TPA: hypothetical protein DCO86_05140 [Spirochaetaceae bacterium]|nr:hypothetical protein [Spirochaetaceae bacterium]